MFQDMRYVFQGVRYIFHVMKHNLFAPRRQTLSPTISHLCLMVSNLCSSAAASAHTMYRPALISSTDTATKKHKIRAQSRFFRN